MISTAFRGSLHLWHELSIPFLQFLVDDTLWVSFTASGSSNSGSAGFIQSWTLKLHFSTFETISHVCPSWAEEYFAYIPKHEFLNEIIRNVHRILQGWGTNLFVQVDCIMANSCKPRSFDSHLRELGDCLFDSVRQALDRLKSPDGAANT